MPDQPEWHEECGITWTTTDAKDHHVCVKPVGHMADITDDDHRCCCGVNTWGSAHA